MASDSLPPEGAPTLRAPAGELPGINLEELLRRQPYAPGQMLGRGGMGEVRLCADTRLERDIAVKTATTKDPAELLRFVREAQVQGQLEHPGIVPVHELGIGHDGAPYFAMKRVKGETLYTVLGRLSKSDPQALEAYPRRRLLQAFVAACQAVDYAHANGWVHRDLKPGNLMLGNFGEVYVLDWGLAGRIEQGSSAPTADAPIDNPLTTPGMLMGTPGYISPEQVVGQSADVRSDIYALGAILFELLTHRPLAAGKSDTEMLHDTRRGCDTRARQRAPGLDIPPELEAICTKAAHKEPSRRYPTVRELYSAVDRVLSGERDDELRRSLAKQHTDAARETMVRASLEPRYELDHRKTALRELGLAIALDPRHRPALKALVEVMTAPTKQVPPEAEAELAAAQLAQRRAAARGSAIGLVVVTAFCVPMVSWLVHHAWVVWLAALLFLSNAALAAYAGWSRRGETRFDGGMVTMTCLTTMSLFFVAGPLTILPLIGALNTVALTLVLDRRWRSWVLASGLVTVLVPLVASWVGVLPESFRFVKEGLLLLPIEVDYHPTGTMVLFLFTFAFSVIGPNRVVGRLADTALEHGRDRVLQAWNLKQMLPEEASGADLLDETPLLPHIAKALAAAPDMPAAATRSDRPPER
jgi:serine/threonine-protein kinase